MDGLLFDKRSRSRRGECVLKVHDYRSLIMDQSLICTFCILSEMIGDQLCWAIESERSTRLNLSTMSLQESLKTATRTYVHSSHGKEVFFLFTVVRQNPELWRTDFCISTVDTIRKNYSRLYSSLWSEDPCFLMRQSTSPEFWKKREPYYRNFYWFKR